MALTPVASAFAEQVKRANAKFCQGIEEIMHIFGSGEESFIFDSLPVARTMILPKAANAMIKEDRLIWISVT